MPFPKGNRLYGARDFKTRAPRKEHDSNYVDFSMIIETPRNYKKYKSVALDANQIPPTPVPQHEQETQVYVPPPEELVKATLN